jgi:galactoside O-acetyltransferase
MSTLARSVVESMGFASVGDNVLISDRASFYNCSQISLGNNVRIDDFCVLSAGQGEIVIGDYVHVAVYSSLIGAGNITISDFCNLSSRVSIYSSNDDYTGASMTNPMVPSQYTGVAHDDVRLCRHVIVGSGTVILPGVTLNDGVAVGALSLVNKDCCPFGVYAGVPAKYIKKRKRDLLKLENAFLSSIEQ